MPVIVAVPLPLEIKWYYLASAFQILPFQLKQENQFHNSIPTFNPTKNNYQ